MSSPPETVEGDSNTFAGIQEQLVPYNEVKISTTDHYVYLKYSDIQLNQGAQTLTVSFHITNGLRDGSVSEYWTDPVTIKLIPWPPRC